MIEWVHPGLILIAGALFLPLFRGAARKVYLLAVTGAALADVVTMRTGVFGTYQFSVDLALTFGRVDRLSLVFAWVFALIAFIGIVYSLHVEETGRHAAGLIYAGSALGAVFAGDLITLFIFWELLAFASVFLIWQAGTPSSLAAGYRYLLVHVAGGASLLAGIIVHVRATDGIAFEAFDPATPGYGLILLGFILNAAVPPLNAWLPDAYPEATVTGAVFMSAFTTKTAVYVLARGFAGSELLMWLGAVMALYGVIYATLQNDARRLLSYHIISQVGYMVCGIGIGTQMAVNGAVAHAFAHILYKALLFMGAGALLHVTGKRRLSDMGGLYRTMPWTFALYMVGAFSISAMPLTSGFVSKSMVTAGAAEHGLTVVFLMLTAASAGTFLSVGLKLPWFAFFGKDSGLQAKEPPTNMLVGMGLAAFFCIFIGIVPGTLYRLLPFPTEFHPYTLQHVVSTMEILLLTGVAFMLLRAKLEPKPSLSLDTDWFYRKVARAFMWVVERPLSSFEYGVMHRLHEAFIKPLSPLASQVLIFDRHGVDRAVDGVGNVAMSAGNALRNLQNGRLHRFLYLMAGGLFLMLLISGFLTSP
jgi:multicomponent Na+:H+ antiporter subunit D